ncbi:endonuclease/exonuclease/phosphatase family protein [Mangrovibacterium diazotrophicum]|uniref:Endonuclease/exonuclease/phosphatase family metal-dependent hydrolase n=1 Tax=Mangrovibacterium diazotrophicum TaxID=1261403 RepID=A0A419W5K3_9BACT|nr:endonuclease/exonuclease/phosphatase family protein [Mangrovibacterium diazotrophicum]RKD90716.1 endonuclease/exonuclease/phosphatase family metal-dependent hydrolase [Mangrovibacterium diazotrophicum]
MRIIKILLVALCAFVVILTTIYFWGKQSAQTPKTILTHVYKEHEIRADSTIFLMTYNIGYLSGMTNNMPTKPEEKLFSDNLNLLKQKLNGELPDLICFQEIDYGSQRSFRVNQHDSIANLFYPWSVCAINWNKRFVPFPYWPPSVWFGQVLSGQSIMSKWELEHPQRMELPKVKSKPFFYNDFYLDRLLVTSMVKHPVRDFIMMNLHAEAFDTITRNQQLEIVYQHFKAESLKYPVILAGDFNATPQSDEPGIHLFLNDSTIGCAVTPQVGKPATYPSENPEERIDYIFFSKKDFIEITGKVDTSYGTISDHLPVTTRLKYLR